MQYQPLEASEVHPRLLALAFLAQLLLFYRVKKNNKRKKIIKIETHIKSCITTI